MEGKYIQVDPLAKTATHLISQCHSYSYPNSDTIGASLTCSPPDDIKADKSRNIHQTDPPFQSTGDRQSQNISRIRTTTRKGKDADERIKAPLSSESSPQFCEEVVVYLNDIEELRSSRRKEADCQDQRLFKFKSLSMPTKGVVVDGTDGDDEGYKDNEVEDEKPSSNAKNSRQRSFSLEPSSMMDVDYQIYYENHMHKSHHYRKHQKKKTVAEREEATYVLKRSKQPGCTAWRGNIQANTLNNEVKTCSLENPCYNSSFDDREEKVPPVCDAGGILDGKFCHCRCSSNDDTRWIRMKESGSPTRNLRRSYDNGASAYGVFTLPKLEKEESIGKVKGNEGASQTRKGAAGPYLRATTMPQERPREVHRYSILRSNSLSIHNPNHVHPKLPEYEDIAAKFMALKKEHLQHKQ